MFKCNIIIDLKKRVEARDISRRRKELPVLHIWELPGNYPVFTMVMEIYHYGERIWIIRVTHNLL